MDLVSESAILMRLGRGLDSDLDLEREIETMDLVLESARLRRLGRGLN